MCVCENKCQHTEKKFMGLDQALNEENSMLTAHHTLLLLTEIL